MSYKAKKLCVECSNPLRVWADGSGVTWRCPVCNWRDNHQHKDGDCNCDLTEQLFPEMQYDSEGNEILPFDAKRMVQ